MSASGGEAQRSAHGGRYTDHSLRRVIRCRALVVREYIYIKMYFFTLVQFFCIAAVNKIKYCSLLHAKRKSNF
jgi:hypothetical protein